MSSLISSSLQHSPYMSSRSYHLNYLLIPFARTLTFFHSFIPSSSSLWNSLPASLKHRPSLHSIIYRKNSHVLGCITLSIYTVGAVCTCISCAIEHLLPIEVPTGGLPSCLVFHGLVCFNIHRETVSLLLSSSV